VLRASAAYAWDDDVRTDCATYAEEYDDDPDFSMCPWYVRGNPYLLGSAVAGVDVAYPENRRGFPYATADDDTANRCATPDDGGDWAGSGAWLCDVDFLNLKFVVPPLFVSGSNVLWAPVTWSTVRFNAIGTSYYDLDETHVTLQSSVPGGSTSQEAMMAWPQPWVATLPNAGVYRLDFSGRRGA
jgi:hypothetical protein